ncbi:uncharacterized protein LACBIDRAFT_313289 [Laccaria bicolor S238N-H82]|uniref:Predicted protein n=1 Tax=Laccaria bicolor (strain S238N-H82 / ATCC MYA-4686) TaxID=486041 RepID=B0DY00_LACBS|nr:uncharacterized protein LACBIDRAFT_313289 [Laccaria bicolor S238N-H82]EDR00598.1 predicted protein [Laccaria bicolor S238N-H82]|eukprot:XP_001888825.1 predicted protein [Laccaria bicolor S238N-H82]
MLYGISPNGSNLCPYYEQASSVSLCSGFSRRTGTASICARLSRFNVGKARMFLSIERIVEPVD